MQKIGNVGGEKDEIKVGKSKGNKIKPKGWESGKGCRLSVR